MRKLLFIFVLCFCVKVESIAQLQKDSWMLEGGILFGREQLNNPDPNFINLPINTFSIGPKVGYFVSDLFAFGLSGRWRGDWSPNSGDNNALLPDSYKSSKSSFGGGVFFRKYLEIKEELSFYGELGSELIRKRVRIKEGNPPNVNSSPSETDVEIYARIGLQYLISPKIGVHLCSNLMHYRSNRTDLEFLSIERQFRTGFFLDPRFGFTIFL